VKEERKAERMRMWGQKESVSAEDWAKVKEERKAERMRVWAERKAAREGTKGEKLEARFAKDVTIEDGTQMPANARFVKTWRLRNEGLPWPAGCGLRFLGRHSDSMGSPDFVPVTLSGEVAANQEVEISIPLVAPAKPGRYTGYWKMSTPEGRKFGQRVWVSIEVPSTPSSSSSSEGERQADKFDALVDLVLAKGFTAKRHRVFRLLQKFDGDVEKVSEVLAAKTQRREACIARRAAMAQMK